MSDPELLWRVAAYLLSFHSLALGAWALAELGLPDLAPLHLRLLTLAAGQLVLTALLVQSLGLCGWLNAPAYFAASLLPGLAAQYFLRRRWPQRSLFRLLGSALRLWLAAPAWGLGLLGAAFVFFLAGRFLRLPEDIDALSLHGPLIVEWVQQGRVLLESHWNYPQCWEYQFVPLFLLLRSDILAAVPSLVAIGALLLAMRALAAELRLPGQVGLGLAWLAASLTVVWRDTFKNDTLFAVALLLGLLAARRAARGLAGNGLPLLLALFLILGTKPSGFLYAGLLAAGYLCALRVGGARRDPGWPRGGGRWRLALLGLLVLASAAAVQLENFLEHGNPVYPVRFAVAGFELFPGPATVEGTSVLEHLGHAETFRAALDGGRLIAGAEWPILLLLLGAALALSAAGLLRRRQAWGFAELLPWVTALLWALFAATPWSCGYHRLNWDYLATGNSFRYAIAPLGLTWLVAALLLKRFLGRRPLAGLARAAPPLLVAWKWQGLGLWQGLGGPLALALVAVAVAAAAAVALGLRRAWPLLAAGRKRRRHAAVALVALILAGAFAWARWVAATREDFWLPGYREAWTRLWREAPSGVVVAVNQPRLHFRYWLYGPNFSNRLAAVQIGKGRGGRIPETAEYLYAEKPGEAELEELIAALEGRGWQTLARPADGSGVLLGRRPGAPR